MDLRDFATREDGAIAVIAALAGSALMAATALMIDLGSVYLQSRKLQGMADLAAIAAARNLPNAQRAAQATVDANGWSGVAVAVATGRYEPDRDTAPGERFRTGAGDANAAHVTLTAPTDLFFGKMILGRDSVTLRREGTAARAQFASYSIGTRLASVNGGAANALLSALAGGKVSLSVMDYNALASARIDLFRYTDALRTAANLEAASFNETLAADLSTARALEALANTLLDQGDTRAAGAVHTIALAAAGVDAHLDSLIDLGPLGEQERLISAGATRAQVAAGDLAKAVLLAGQEGRQLKLDLDANLPGVLDVDVWLAVGERPNKTPWLTLGDGGEATIRTNEARLFVEAKTLSVLGVVGAKPVTLPVLVELAPGEAKLRSIACTGSAPQDEVTLDVRPGLGRLTIGDIDRRRLSDFKHDLDTGPATLVDLGLIKAEAFADVSLGGKTWQKVRFSRSEIDEGRVKSVRTEDLAQASLSTLLGKTRVTARVAGLPSATLDTALLGSLNALGAPLDGLINGLTDLLGVRLGEADVQVHGLRCRDAALVA